MNTETFKGIALRFNNPEEFKDIVDSLCRLNKFDIPEYMLNFKPENREDTSFDGHITISAEGKIHWTLFNFEPTRDTFWHMRNYRVVLNSALFGKLVDIYNNTGFGYGDIVNESYHLVTSGTKEAKDYVFRVA